MFILFSLLYIVSLIEIESKFYFLGIQPVLIKKGNIIHSSTKTIQLLQDRARCVAQIYHANASSEIASWTLKYNLLLASFCLYLSAHLLLSADLLPVTSTCF